MNNLNKKEQKETVFSTLGRLRISIIDGRPQRSLDLLGKIYEDVSDMDSQLFKIGKGAF